MQGTLPTGLRSDMSRSVDICSITTQAHQLFQSVISPKAAKNHLRAEYARLPTCRPAPAVCARASLTTVAVDRRPPAARCGRRDLSFTCLLWCHKAARLVTVYTHALGEPDVNIFVGNVAFTTTEQDLRQLFEPYGTVGTIRIITDRDTGRSRGFGFVEIPDDTAARGAIAGLQGQELDGRALTVNEARPREDRREPHRPRW
jgi:hypothetical protein